MSIRSIFSNSKSYFQSLAILSFGLILTTSLATFSLPKVSVNAGAGPRYMIVTHPNGINIRDKNCKVVDQIGYGEVLDRASDNPVNLTCNIGGQNIEMLNQTLFNNGSVQLKDIYVASKFVQKVKSGISGTFTTYNKIKLDNPNGVNLRDEKCQRVITLPNGTYSENPSDINVTNYVFSPGLKICKAGSEFYSMIPFVYKGKSYQVAEVLTKYE